MTKAQPRQRRLAGNVELVRVHVVRAPKVSDRLTIQALNTLILMRDGTVVAGRGGAAPASGLRSRMNEVLRGAA